MIHKIEKLVSIGKFRNYQAAGQVDFHKLTLIFGDNGSGKTTLTAVLRSLAQNKPEIITSRISTNNTAPQAGQIIQRVAGNDIYHTFRATGWTNPFPDIEIFDIHFVNENIYSGFDFNNEHKKQLHQFVIGAQGVAIRQQIEQNKIDKTASRQNQTNLEQQLIQQVGNSLSDELISGFLSTPATQANNIDQLITAEAALNSANSNAVIQTLQSLSTLNTINSGIDFTAIITDLQTTTQAIQDAGLQAVFETHCNDLSDNSIEAPDNWLRTGFNYLESKQRNNEDVHPLVLSCPFCKQTVDNNLDIIKAYTLRFNDDFNSLVQRIQAHIDTLQNFNLEAIIQALYHTNQNNSGYINSWTAHLPNNVQTPIYNIIPDEVALKAEFQALIASVQQKAQNPSAIVSTTSAITFQTSLQTLDTNIATYNQAVINYNTAITNFRAGIQTVIQAQDEVNRLKRIKKRFEPEISTLCTQLVAERQNLRTLETAYTQLVQQQTAATTVFSNYKDRINYYLGTVFKTLFRIDNVVHVPPQGRATQSRIDYKLTIDGSDISFDNNQPFSAKECLSEGDKSTIALAFFLSKLDIDPNRQDKILLFDDPLSSLDTNRRTYTVGIIKSLFQQMKQVVVLSHNEHFLYEISKDFGASDKKTLRITENFAAKASTIEVCDLEELVENNYFKHIKELEKFRVNPNHAMKDTVLGWMRNVLEAHIRFKFYRQCRNMPSNQKTFRRLIEFIDTQGVIFRDNANRTTIINNLKQINSVSWRPHHGDPMPDFGALGINPNTMSAAELDSLIVDTLHLIDNQL